MPKEEKATKSTTVKQYPGCFRGKRVYIKSADGEITRGLLSEIQEYSGTKLLIVQMDGAEAERMVAFNHITFIDEL